MTDFFGYLWVETRLIAPSIAILFLKWHEHCAVAVLVIKFNIKCLCSTLLIMRTGAAVRGKPARVTLH